MEERRREKRHELDPQLQVLDGETGEELGRVVNISPQGLQILSTQRFNVDQNTTLQIILPQRILGKASLDVDVRCAWANPEGFYGMEFTRVAPTDSSVILALIIHQNELQHQH